MLEEIQFAFCCRWPEHSMCLLRERVSTRTRGPWGLGHPPGPAAIRRCVRPHHSLLLPGQRKLRTHSVDRTEMHAHLRVFIWKLITFAVLTSKPSADFYKPK
ncbi:Toxoplasma gondii family C protein [Toxoplasma gondii VAND]|uniref:Toxoplasma gondii family C protein n=1 Tax=Toxoplasma gondii VAND TaxID=933077 RepID=A0A086PG65_TOXGO|nr:Toxoplasma gondii family C protein [Toxoplasma gondii VAND]